MKFIHTLFFIIFGTLVLNAQKNVGIGLNTPSSRIHLHQESLSNDPESAIQFTNSTSGNTLADGLRMALSLNNASIINKGNGKLSLGTSNVEVFNILSNGKVGINTSDMIGAADFTINSFSQFGFGGMYLNVNDNLSGKPFYGYAINGSARAWTYFDAIDNKWVVYNGGDRLFLANNGNMGLGISSPVQKLDIAGRIKIGTEITADSEGSIQYKDGDFSGYTAAGKWESLTNPTGKQSMSYDDEIDFEFCSSPDQYWVNSGISGSTVNSTCGVVYDSGGPSGNYAANENFSLFINGGGATMIKIIIEELVIEDDNDQLWIGTYLGDFYKFTKTLTEPDTLILGDGLLFFQFISDGSIQKPGFKVRYEFLNEVVPQEKQYSGYYYDFDKKSLAAGLNTGNYWADSLGEYSISMGISSKATDVGSIAIGWGSSAKSNLAVSLGIGAEANADFGLALGNYSSANHEESTALGRSAHATASNSIVIGQFSISSIGGYQNWSNLSDGRFKTDVKEDIPGLEFINELRPVSYKLDIEKLNNFMGIGDRSSKDKYAQKSSNQVRSGFIAQEVLRASSKLGYDFSGVNKPQNKKDHFSLRYAEFVVPLVVAVQQLSEENEKLKEELKKMEALEKRITLLEGKSLKN